MAKPSLLNEKELLSLIAKGDTRAFAKVYDFYRKRVYTVSLQYLHIEEKAEDAVQEIFLKLWRQEDQLNSIQSLEAYLLKVTKHQCLNILRRIKLESLHIIPLNEGFEHLDTSTEESIILKDTRRIINDGVVLLPQQQKLAYQLCHIDGMKYAEAASQLKIAPETVRTHLKLALKFLRIYVSKRTDIMALLIIFKLR